MTNLKIIYCILLLTLAFISTNAQYRHDSLKISHGYLHYYVEGKGEPIVYLQGGPGYSGIDLKQIADSFPKHQNILIDFEGTGLSQYREADTSWVTIENIIANIEAVRKKLNIKKLCILGHSYGTHFALYYAVKYRQYVSKILLVASCGSSNEFEKIFHANIINRFSFEDTNYMKKVDADTSINEKRKAAIIDSMWLKPYFYNKSKLGFYLATIPEDYLPTYYNDKFYQAYTRGSQYRNFNIDKQIRSLSIPILIIQGRQDPIGDGVPILLQQKIKNCRLEFINKCGHFAWIEKPNEFYQFAKAFLNDSK
jgi:proline iminopeptidase